MPLLVPLSPAGHVHLVYCPSQVGDLQGPGVVGDPEDTGVKALSHSTTNRCCSCPCFLMPKNSNSNTPPGNLKAVSPGRAPYLLRPGKQAGL